MEKFDDDTMSYYIDFYSKRTFNMQLMGEFNVRKINFFIKKLIEEDSCYTNTLLAIIYYEGYLHKKDNEKFVYYMKRAAKKGSYVAYACLAICYYYGFVVNKDRQLANKILTEYRKTLTYKSLDLGYYNSFREFLHEAGKKNMRDIGNLFSAYYINLYKYYAMRFNDKDVLKDIALKVRFYGGMAIVNGSRNINFKLYDFYRHYVLDNELAFLHLKHAAIDDKDEKAIELYERLVLSKADA